MKKHRVIFGCLFMFFVLAVPVGAQFYIERDNVLGDKTEKNATKTGKENNKAVIGSVEEKKGFTVVIGEKNRKTEAVFDAKTKIVGKDKKNILPNQIKLKDKIALISTDSGAIASDGAKIRKILKVYIKEASGSAQNKRHAVSGVISAINGQQITLTHQTQRDRSQTILRTASTVIVSKSVTDLTIGMRIAVMGDVNTMGVLEAKRIHVIPGLATGIFTKRPFDSTASGQRVTTTPATGSAILTVTPVATVSSTPFVISPTSAASVSATPTL